MPAEAAATDSQVATEHIVLFDGVCNLCNGAVQFILQHEALPPRLKFASLQSESGQRLLRKFQLNTQDFDSMVLVQGESYALKSTAVLKIAGYLKAPWSWGRLLLILPAMLRNPVYQWVAANRYKWFGKKDQCWLPTPDLRARFLD